MDIKLHEILVKDLYDGYVDEGESGVYAYDDKLSVRPPYQREFVYSQDLQDAVINSIVKDFPLNVMYWMIAEKDSDGKPSKFELLDGQQRTLSICRYIDGDFSITVNGSEKFYTNLTPDEKKQIDEYKLLIYWCEGTDTERLDWFKTINIGGLTLTDQELRNAVYTGPWITDAKRTFSKTGCYAKNLGDHYIKGDYLRQGVLETVLKWACDKDGISSIAQYMAIHQHDSNAKDLKDYFTDIIDWIEDIFPDYSAKMKDVQWGLLYNRYHTKYYDVAQLKADVQALMADYEVQKKASIYEFVLGGKRDTKLLNLRAFDEPTKRAQYAQQNGRCPMCGKKFEYEDMHGDHKTAWVHGGKTVPENCQMLCTECNLKKKAQDANFV